MLGQSLSQELEFKFAKCPDFGLQLPHFYVKKEKKEFENETF